MDYVKYDAGTNTFRTAVGTGLGAAATALGSKLIDYYTEPGPKRPGVPYERNAVVGRYPKGRYTGTRRRTNGICKLYR